MQEIVANLLLGFLSYFVPKKKNQILFGSAGGFNFVGSPKYFFLFLCQNKTPFIPMWIATDKKLFLELNKKKLPVKYLYSFEGFKAILRSNFLIFSHLTSDVSFYSFLPGRFKKINTWHGIPLKKNEAKVYHKNPTFKEKWEQRFVFLSERRSYRLILASYQYKNIEILVYPRNDVLFNPNLIYEDYRKKFHLQKYKKIFLFCPTYRDNPTSKRPFSQDFLEKLDDYCVKENKLFLIKKHVLDRSIDNLEKFSNIKDISGDVEDIQDLLVQVDVIISDYSSIFFDFVLLRRPMIFYPYDLNEYIQTRKLYYDYFTELPGPFSKNEEELFENIKSIDIIFQEKLYQEKYERFQKRFNKFQDGESCSRLLEYLKKNNSI